MRLARLYCTSKGRLKFSSSIEYNYIMDPKGWSEDVSALGSWDNGDVEVVVSSIKSNSNKVDGTYISGNKELKRIGKNLRQIGHRLMYYLREGRER